MAQVRIPYSALFSTVLTVTFLSGCWAATTEDTVIAVDPDALISDQVHGGGTRSFFFGPPIAPIVSYRGVFESRLGPEVSLRKLDAQGKPSTEVARYRSDTRAYGSKVRRDLNGGFYIVRLHSDRLKLDAGKFYRVEVYVGVKRFGFADIAVVRNPKQASQVDKNRYVALVAGDTLPVRFRVEKKAVDKDGDGAFDWLDNCPSVSNPPVSLPPDVQWVKMASSKKCRQDMNECDLNELDCNPITSVIQQDADRDGIGDACECAAGYTGGGITPCVDVDECSALPQACDPRTTCTNAAGSYSCGACPAGFSGTGKTGCVDIDECATGEATCSTLVTCSNTVGSYQCGGCPTGYAGNGQVCTDVNECDTGNGGCDPLTTCTNTPGSYSCGDCPAGFTGGGTSGCIDVDECMGATPACDPLASCVNTPGGYTCGPCPAGYLGDGSSCTDIDECAQGLASCSPLVVCSNTSGGYLCGSCPSGYTGNGQSCTDIDECLTNNGGCSEFVTCTNLSGSMTCGACPPGYTGNGYQCTDIDECGTTPAPCDVLVSCTNTAGGYSCGPCPAGYTGDGRSCLDIDECAQGTDDCSRTPRVGCSNTAGGYTCGACPLGYTGDGRQCTDIDECLTSNGGCSPLVDCTNTLGGFTCGSCPPGYTGDGASCTDIDECAAGGCSAGVACTNLPGTFRCDGCLPGFSGDGATGCVDIDECALGTHACSQYPLVSCTNTPGSYVCGACPAGYAGDGRTCEDINECLINNGGCGLQSCVNVYGAYACSPYTTWVEAGEAHTCAGAHSKGKATTTGAFCWGAGNLGQLGNGSTADSATPVIIPALLQDSGGPGTLGSVGYHHSCVVHGTGVSCWGSNSAGQLGDGSTTDRHSPVEVTGLLAGGGSLAAGEAHSCAEAFYGEVYCWGANTHGQLGTGSTSDASMPAQVTLSGGVYDLSAGRAHTCAVLPNHTVSCWGRNAEGQLGIGSSVDSPVPATVPSLTDAVAVAAGAAHTCVVRVGGEVVCWGDNRDGQLGSALAPSSTVPVLVSNLTAYILDIAAGATHTCALTNNSEIYCWGNGTQGQLGNGSTTSSSIPVRVVGIPSDQYIMSLSAGGGHTCASHSNGVYCWGSGSRGQLGSGTTADSPVPVSVVGLAPTP